jgi:beta-lactamase regulating signal transducer with metallopeptidase domain
MQGISAEMIYALGWMVVNSLWQSAVIALVLAALLVSFPRLSAHWRYNAAYAALILVVTAAGWTFFHYYHQALTAAALPSGDWVWSIQQSPIAGVEKTSAPVFWEDWKNWFNDYFDRNLPLIVYVWFSGLVFFMLRLLGGVAYVQHLKQHGIQEIPAYWQQQLSQLASTLHLQRLPILQESTKIHVPMVIGYWKPTILIPLGMLGGLSQAQVEAILAHELAHIYRHDFLLNLFQTLIDVLFYFNPAVWWISATIRNEREHCCDDIAVDICGNALVYAKALVHLQELRLGSNPMLAMAAVGRRKVLLSRVRRILHQPSNAPDIMEKFTVTCLILLAGLFLSVKAEYKEAPLPEAASISKVDMFPAQTDTLPPGNITLRTSKNGKKFDVVVENGAIKALKVNGKEVPAAQFKTYENEVAQLIKDVPPPPPPPTAPTPPTPPGFPNMPTPPGFPNMPAPPPPPGVRHNGQEEVIIRRIGPGPKDIEVQVTPRAEYGLKIERSFIIKDGDSIEIVRNYAPEPKTYNIQYGGMHAPHPRAYGTERPMTFEYNFDIADSIRSNIDKNINVVINADEIQRMTQNLEQRVIIDGQKMRNDMNRQFRQMPFQGMRAPDVNFRMEGPGSGRSFFRGGGTPNSIIEESLSEDELIANGRPYSFELTKAHLKIDGTKMPEPLHQKYLRIYEQSSGMRLEDNSRIIIKK